MALAHRTERRGTTLSSRHSSTGIKLDRLKVYKWPSGRRPGLGCNQESLWGSKVAAVSQSKGSRVNFGKLQTCRRKKRRRWRRTTFTANCDLPQGHSGEESLSCAKFTTCAVIMSSPNEHFRKTGTDGTLRSVRTDAARTANPVRKV